MPSQANCRSDSSIFHGVSHFPFPTMASVMHCVDKRRLIRFRFHRWRHGPCNRRRCEINLKALCFGTNSYFACSMPHSRMKEVHLVASGAKAVHLNNQCRFSHILRWWRPFILSRFHFAYWSIFNYVYITEACVSSLINWTYVVVLVFFFIGGLYCHSSSRSIACPNPSYTKNINSLCIFL